MRYTERGQQTGGRRLTAFAVRWLVDGSIPARCRRAWAWARLSVVGIKRPVTSEREERRNPSSGSPAPFACPGPDAGAARRGLPAVLRRSRLPMRRRADSGRVARLNPARAAALLPVLTILAACLTGQAQAQTAYVSNTGQDGSSGFSVTGSISQAQGFTTGAQSGGYTLGSVGLKFISGSSTAAGLGVAIYSEAAGGGPDAAVYTLTNPSALARNGTEQLFTAPASATLSVGTTYYVVVTTASSAYSVVITAETDEDSGASAGWSIEDTRYFRNTSVNNDWGTSAAKLKVSIYPPSTTTLSTDATLSGLDLEDNTGTAITLTPTFVSGTTSYTAMVANSVDEITIAPTVNESNAAYEIQDSGGTALTDADTNTTGFQVDLTVGATTIKVEVTAEDTTTDTYQVTVTRATATPLPTHCETGDIWCANMTVGSVVVVGTTIAYGYTSEATGSLSHDRFEYDGTDYSVAYLIHGADVTSPSVHTV